MNDQIEALVEKYWRWMESDIGGLPRSESVRRIITDVWQQAVIHNSLETDQLRAKVADQQALLQQGGHGIIDLVSQVHDLQVLVKRMTPVVERAQEWLDARWDDKDVGLNLSQAVAIYSAGREDDE